MKKTLALLILITLLLTGCQKKEEEIVIDYTLFSDNVTTYKESESIDEEIYAVYYYDSTDSSSDDLFKTIYTTYNQFDSFKIYVLDTLNLEDTDSLYGAYVSEPVLYVVKNNEVLETYLGSNGISDFISMYVNLDYELFSDQFATSINQSKVASSNIHFEYYFSQNCGHCKDVKQDILFFFMMNNDLEVFFFDVGVVGWEVPIDEFKGTPTLYLIEDNEVKETYVGKDSILGFIEEYNEGNYIID